MVGTLLLELWLVWCWHEFLLWLATQNSCCDWQHYKYDPDQSSLTTPCEFIDHQVGRTRWTRKVYDHIMLTAIKHQERRRKRSVTVWAIWHAKLKLVRVWNVLEATSLHLCNGTRLFVIPNVDNQAQRWKFVSHDQIVYLLSWLCVFRYGHQQNVSNRTSLI